MVRRQKAIAEKEELTRQKARAADEKKRAEKKAALLAKKKVRWDGSRHPWKGAEVNVRKEIIIHIICFCCLC